MTALEGKVGIVTGGSAGIGRATALAAASEGAAVVVSDVDEERGEAVAAEIRDGGGEAAFVRCDVSSDGEVEQMVAATVERFGHLDFAFNNAGIEGVPAPVQEATPELWARIIAVNLTGVWSCMRHQVPHLLARGGGSIVNCSSIAGLVGFPGMTGYVASKFGVVGLTKTVALEGAEHGVRVNAVCPGVIDTEMVERFTRGDAEAEQQLVASEPMARMGTPREIADTVVWLCSDKASFVTGQAIAVDGGYVAR